VGEYSVDVHCMLAVVLALFSSAGRHECCLAGMDAIHESVTDKC